METISPLIPIVNAILLIGSLLLWMIQRFYKATLIFALVQLGTAYFAVRYVQVSMQEFVPVMGVFYALSVLFIMIHTCIRLNGILKCGKHSKDHHKPALQKG